MNENYFIGARRLTIVLMILATIVVTGIILSTPQTNQKNSIHLIIVNTNVIDPSEYEEKSNDTFDKYQKIVFFDNKEYIVDLYFKRSDDKKYPIGITNDGRVISAYWGTESSIFRDIFIKEIQLPQKTKDLLYEKEFNHTFNKIFRILIFLLVMNALIFLTSKLIGWVVRGFLPLKNLP